MLHEAPEVQYFTANGAPNPDTGPEESLSVTGETAAYIERERATGAAQADSDPIFQKLRGFGAELAGATDPDTVAARHLADLDAAAAKLEILRNELPSHEVKNEDVAWLNAMLPSLHVLPFKYAAPILRRELVGHAIKSGRAGRVRAALPILRALSEKRGSGYDDNMEVRLFIQELEGVSRTAEYFRVRRSLEKLQYARFWIGQVMQEHKATNGRLADSPLGRVRVTYMGQTSGVLESLGIAPAEPVKSR